MMELITPRPIMGALANNGTRVAERSTITPQSAKLRLITEGWPGWVDLDDRLHIKVVYLPTGGCPSKY